MANMNIITPRFYVDQVSYLLSRGITQNGEFDLVTGTNLIALQTGTEPEIFDMKPLNKVDFNTSASRTDHVLINIDTQSTTTKKSFVAILNHNLNSCTGKISIGGGTAAGHINNEDFAGGHFAPSCTEVINADTISTNVITPATDGHTIVTFPETNQRYWGIQFEGSDSGNFDASTDLFFGCVLFGEYYDMPHSPNLAVKRSIDFDKIELQESLGGQRYSNAISFGRQASSVTKSPFTNAVDGSQIYGGRINYDMTFSYLNSTDLMPDNYDSVINNATDDAVVEDIWNKTNGRHIPFIFTADGSSTSESDYLFARFGNDRLDMTQVSHNIWDISLKIEEEF